MAGNLQSYRFKGIPAEGTGRNLAEAIDDLSDFWSTRPTLVSHRWGVLTLQITVGSTPVIVEVSDPDILDDLSVGDTSSLIHMFARDMQLSAEDTASLLEETTQVVATVDRIRPPSGSGMMWHPDAGLSPEVVMPQAAMDWVADVGHEVDRQVRRDKGRPRTKRGRKLLRMVVRSGHELGMTNAQIARRTKIPVSTIRDAWTREQREQRTVKEFKGRTPGQRYTEEQKKIVAETLSRTGNNAAEAARRLGIAPRTVRDLRRSMKTTKAKRKKYTDQDKTKLLNLVRDGKLSATEAGRRMGIAGRTARGWVRKAKLASDK